MIHSYLMATPVLIGLAVVVRIAIGTMLLVAGAAKLNADIQSRVRWLSTYRLVPQVLLVPLAWTLPLAEVLAGSTLVIGAFGIWAPVFAGTLLSFITGVTTIALARGVRTTCGCFGKFDRGLISWRLVGRNMSVTICVSALIPADVTSLSVYGAPIAIQSVWVAAIAIGILVLLYILHSRQQQMSADATSAN
jgi:uncharacterized membrane protein YphA (DoxX/SURF4 family)